MKEFTLDQFIRFVETTLPRNLHHAQKAALHLIAASIAAEARRVLGTYDYGWEELADVTKEERARLGYPDNEPLLRSGALRSSIGFTVHSHERAEVGSTSDIAVFHELGTSRIPARPFLSTAAMDAGPQAIKAAGKMLADAIKNSGSITGSDAWSLAKFYAKAIVHLAKNLAGEDDETPDYAGEIMKHMGHGQQG